MTRKVNELLSATSVHLRETIPASHPSRVVWAGLVVEGRKVERRVHTEETPTGPNRPGSVQRSCGWNKMRA